MPEKLTKALRIVRFGTFTQCSVIYFSFLPAWLLSPTFCYALIQVDKLPDANQIIAGHQQQQPLDFTESFEGVDYRTYYLNESYPDTAVMDFWKYYPTIDANDTDSSVLKCRVVHPLIIAEQVYLQIFTANNSTKIFTGGRTLLAKTESNQGSGLDSSDVRWWRREEYQFDLHFNTNMSRAACLGMDRNGAWRKSEDTIRFHCRFSPFALLLNGYAPTLKRNISMETSNRSFVVGGNYMLECPFELDRFPNPKVSWELPSGLGKRSGECLWFSNVRHENAGQYTCTAKNKYGNGTYSFHVSVRDPTFLERLKRKFWKLVGNVWEYISVLVVLFLMITGFIEFPRDIGVNQFDCAWVNPVETLSA